MASAVASALGFPVGSVESGGIRGAVHGDGGAAQSQRSSHLLHPLLIGEERGQFVGQVGVVAAQLFRVRCLAGVQRLQVDVQDFL